MIKFFKVIITILLSLLIEPLVFIILFIIAGLIYSSEQNETTVNMLIIISAILIISIPIIISYRNSKKRLEEKMKKIEEMKNSLTNGSN
jgi:hypothetical protein